MAQTADQFKEQMLHLLPRLHRFALSLTKSVPDAEDLLQDACASALQNWRQYDPSYPFDHWMFRIVRNQWIEEMLKSRVRAGAGQVPVEHALELSVESRVDAILTAKKVHQIVSDLDPKLSQPLLLVCGEGYTYQETSDILGIPIGTVMSRIYRARKTLVSFLSPTGGNVR